MQATLGQVINIALVSLEFIAVCSLWVWLFIVSSRLKKQFNDTSINITEVSETDPNTDVRGGISYLTNQASAILPLIAAFAALDAFFSNQIVSYFTLFPLLISLVGYYYIFASHNAHFLLSAPRSEMTKNAPAAQVIKYDKENRKELLKRFMKFYRFSIVGHLNFVVGVLAFVAGTIIDKSYELSTINLVGVMAHVSLIGYIIAFLAEVLFFKHKFTTGK